MTRDKQHASSSERTAWSLFLHQLYPQSDPTLVELMQKLRIVSHALYQQLEGQSAEINLSFAQYRILLHLHFCETMQNRPSLNPSEISQRHGVNRNTASSLISSLEKGGYIVRQLDAQDRRKFNIGLTDAGRQLVREHFRCHAQKMGTFFTVLNDHEREAFGLILDKLAQKLFHTNT